MHVALFRTFDGMLYAVDNRDPFGGQYVPSRGDAPTMASPPFKQAFDLRTGRCVGDARTSVPGYEARRSGGSVQVRVGGP